jgi:hypothetical protein
MCKVLQYYEQHKQVYQYFDKMMRFLKYLFHLNELMEQVGLVVDFGLNQMV